jgi:hypothetical protein
MIVKIYEEMLKEFPSTLRETSADDTNSKFMTSCQETVVNLDSFKKDFRRKLSSNSRPIYGEPTSCDALLYMMNQNVFFMIEFKNGRINRNEVRIKVLESLLMLSKKFSIDIEYTRDNMNFIFVYNEDTNKEYMRNRRNRATDMFGLEYFKNLYFKNINAYSKAEFEEKFVRKYCTT